MGTGKAKKPLRGMKTSRKANGRQERTPYHNAAFDTIRHRLRKYQKNGDITLSDELQLSRGPLKIDFLVVKKNRDFELEPPWAKCFRNHNIIEYKSPVDTPPTPAGFCKLIGYAWIYASQHDIPIGDVTATLICSKEPQYLLNVLKNTYGYKILRKGDGIYYIIQKGAAAENTLAVQIVVEKSDLMLLALDKAPQDAETNAKIADFIINEALSDKNHLSYWFKALPPEHLNNVSERMENMDRERQKAWMNLMKKTGIYDRAVKYGQQIGRQEGRQIGRQEGRQEAVEKIYSLINQGHTPLEAMELVKTL
jgi:hypothetical protein